MLTVLVVMQLAAADGRGEGPAPVSAVERLQPRVRGALHLAGAAGFSGFTAGIGPGISAEIGTTWQDTTSFVFRVTMGTIVVVHVTSFSLGVDFALSDHLSLGSGLSVGFVGGLFVQDLPSATALFVPVRLVFAPFPREPSWRGRKGLSFFFEAAPGLRLFGGVSHLPVPPPEVPWFSLIGALGVGYAWW